jgi:type IV pilus assembly protein PilY1
MLSEAKNIINFTRGEEGLSQVGTDRSYRNRTLDIFLDDKVIKGGDGIDDTVFRLGDVIHSTITMVQSPAEDYDLIYKDNTYRKFRKNT